MASIYPIISGKEGARQGAEERSSLLSKLLFSRQANAKGSITEIGDKTLMMASSTPKKASSTPQRTSTMPSLPPAIPPLSPINIEIQREPLSRTSRGITITKEPRGEERIISQGGDLGLPRTSIFNFPYSSAFPSAFTSPPLALRPVPEVFTQRSESREEQSTTHVIEIHSSDVEAGLNQLLQR